MLKQRFPHEPLVKVGIMSRDEIKAELIGAYRCGDALVTGPLTASVVDGKVSAMGLLEDEIEFTPCEPDCSFELKDVMIGVEFHWQRLENQRFVGALRLIVEDGKVTAVNVLPVEQYLRSVISSEMSATSSLELLKAHAVISRSWLLAQIDNGAPHHGDTPLQRSSDNAQDEIIKWWDHEDHTRFDVCADDHCQRYQGITRQTTDAVNQAVEATAGEILTFDDEICDARFSKCCGGVFERFENCWDDTPHPYLIALADLEDENHFPNLTQEVAAEEWILGHPAAHCNTQDAQILRQVLNNYDQETADFYRWRVEYTQDELAQIIADRTGIDFGRIVNLIPVERGTSGRLSKMTIQGTKREVTIGKELMIRRSLSRSHLYSSAFVVERADIDPDGVPGRFILHGAGWGHGVGLCQIGAAVMAAKGYPYDAILSHYFPHSELTQLYSPRPS
ncbi:MAG: SpoIID/LytB domain-containing protein [Bacteroidales bacterium]|nr:SpoIID/LytB domain-containing protein [Bacteroidales bacterium]